MLVKRVEVLIDDEESRTSVNLFVTGFPTSFLQRLVQHKSHNHVTEGGETIESEEEEQYPVDMLGTNR